MGVMIKTVIATLATSALLLVGCSKPQSDSAPVPADATTYAVKGYVEAIKDNGAKLTVDHEEIPGYMRAMTMDFTVKNPSEAQGLEAGEQIAFTFVVSKSEGFWITGISETGQKRAAQAAHDHSSHDHSH